MLDKIEKYAKEYMVPIMQKEGIEFLKEFIKKNNIQSILEIGSAIGYSAIQMALVDKNIHVITLERDENRYREAVKNIKAMQLQDQIDIYLCDAFDFTLTEKVDMLFIDAAKSQNKKFFERFELMVNRFIITDNLAFHGLVYSKQPIISKNVRSMVKKIEEYIEFLKENSDYKTTIYNIGDGIGISEKV